MALQVSGCEHTVREMRMPGLQPLEKRPTVIRRRTLLAGAAGCMVLAAGGLAAVIRTRRSTVSVPPRSVRWLGDNLFGAGDLGQGTPVLLASSGTMGGFGAWQSNASPPVTAAVEAGAGRGGGYGAVLQVPSTVARSWYSFEQTLASPSQGVILHFSAWVRTEQVTGGFGAYLAINYYSADGARITFSQSPGLTGNNDWTPMTVWSIVPAGTQRFMCNLILYGYGTAVFDGVTLRSHAPVPADYAPEVQLHVTRQRLSSGLYGFGVQTNPQAFLPPNVMTGQDVQLVRSRLEALRPAWVRIFTDTSWWVTDNGYDFTLPGAAAILDVVRLYEPIGTRANLVMWRTSASLSSDYGQLVAAMVALIKWLREQRMNNIRALTLYNGPDVGFPGTTAEYVDMYRRMADALHQSGLADIELVGGDVSQYGATFLDAVAPPLKGTIGMLSYHDYVQYEQPLILPVRLAEQMAGTAKEDGTPAVFQWESNVTGGQGAGTFSPGLDSKGVLLSARYATALKLVAFYLQELAAGLKGSSYWDLFDYFYGTESGSPLMQFGLWGAKREGYPLRPIYYAYQLLTGLIVPGTNLLQVEASPSRALIAYSADPGGGRRILYVLNPWAEPVRVQVQLAERPLWLQRWTLDRDTVAVAIRERRLQLPHTWRPCLRDTLEDVVPAEAMLVYQLRDL